MTYMTNWERIMKFYCMQMMLWFGGEDATLELIGVLHFLLQNHRLYILLRKKSLKPIKWCSIISNLLEVKNVSTWEYGWMPNSHGKITLIISKQNVKCNWSYEVTGRSWGADKQSLIYIYKALMRSTIDYGCIVYSLACKTSLKKI